MTNNFWDHCLDLYFVFMNFQIPLLDEQLDNVNNVLQTDLSSLIQKVCFFWKKYSSFYIIFRSRRRKLVTAKKKKANSGEGCQER